MTDGVLVPYDEYKELIDTRNKYRVIVGKMQYWKARADELNRENYGLKQTVKGLRAGIEKVYGHPNRNNYR